MSQVRITAIHVYPVKSARGIALPQASIGERGIDGDRRWMVVDDQGHFVTQREAPRLCLIETQLGPHELVLRAPGLPALRLPARAPGPLRKVVVWDDDCEAVSVGAEASAWITAALATPCHLVHMPDATRRPVSAKYTGGADLVVSFADAFPFLVVSEASLADLNARLPAGAGPLPMDRFRPNLVVSGCAAYAEDGWTSMTVGPIVMRPVKACSRCSITTVDQATGDRGVEPLRTLAGYRNVEGKVLFGQNLVHTGQGSLTVGDPVDVA